MYRLVIVTAIGNYTVDMGPEPENPTSDDLMKLFLDTKADVDAGCFMEGWTPNDALSGPPGVFAIGSGLDILAYHVQCVIETDLPVVDQPEPSVKPRTIKAAYLGNTLIAKCVEKTINGVSVIVCYDVNGEVPTDVLSIDRLTDILMDRIKSDNKMELNEFLIQIPEDGKPRNFSQAVEILDKLEAGYQKVTRPKTGKAWSGWKGGAE